jgi:hypothetical protein
LATGPSIEEVTMSIGRIVIVIAVAWTLTVLAVQPALAADSERGFLSCPAGRVVWITQRTSAGTTTVAWRTGQHRSVQLKWTTAMTRTGLRSTWWLVTTTGAMDHGVTGASCRG